MYRPAWGWGEGGVGGGGVVGDSRRMTHAQVGFSTVVTGGTEERPQHLQ